MSEFLKETWQTNFNLRIRKTFIKCWLVGMSDANAGKATRDIEINKSLRQGKLMFIRDFAVLVES